LTTNVQFAAFFKKVTSKRFEKIEEALSFSRGDYRRFGRS
jgi:hypothetical protein